MITINLFGGPGTGKSTMRAGLFFRMKNMGLRVEEVTEYAKDVTYDETNVLLSDQLFVLANQNRRLTRLAGKVDFAISDSPLLLSVKYVPASYLPKNFVNLTLELFNTYTNINIFLTRVKPYAKYGRTQSKDEAIQIDDEILVMLDNNKIPYLTVPGNEQGLEQILEYLKSKGYISPCQEITSSTSTEPSPVTKDTQGTRALASRLVRF